MDEASNFSCCKKKLYSFRDIYDQRQSCVGNIHLIPHRFMPLFDKPDPVELLSLLSKDCQLYPRGININIGNMSKLFLSSLYAERLALDGGLSLPIENPTYTSIISCLLEDVVNLRLKCDKYDRFSGEYDQSSSSQWSG